MTPSPGSPTEPGLVERLERVANQTWPETDEMPHLLREAAAALRSPLPDREAVARIIDPYSWGGLDNGDAERDYVGRNGGRLPTEQELFAHVDWDGALTKSLTKADEILALPPSGGDALKEALEARAIAQKALVNVIGQLDTWLSGSRFTKPKAGQIILHVASVERLLGQVRQSLAALSTPLEQPLPDDGGRT